MLNKDYASAKRYSEKALKILHEEDQPKEVARAKYFLALAQLEGKRPFIQTQPNMSSVESLLLSAIALQHSYAYMLTLAIFKRDFARNGLPYLEGEARELIMRSKTSRSKSKT